MRGCRDCLALVLVLGCGDNTRLAPIDAAEPPPEADAPPYVCWYDPPYTPGGTIKLGTGAVTFEPMPDMPQLEPPGMQIPAFDLAVNAQITGLAPGNPNDPLDPGNPHTRFRGFFVDNGESVYPAIGPCGVRLGYVPAGSGTFTMARGTPLAFDPIYTGTDLFGRQVHIILEIIDANLNYAIDEKTVTLQPPP